MALDIYAAKDLNHAFEIASMVPEKRMEDHVVSEPEEIGDFLYDIHAIINSIHTGKSNWKRTRFRQSRLFHNPSSSGLRNMAKKKTV